MEAIAHEWVPIGTLLVRASVITAEQLEIALTERERGGRRLGEIVVEWGWASSDALARALADQYALDFFDLIAEGVDDESAQLLPEEDAHRLQALPIRQMPDGVLLVGIADPTDLAAAEELRELLGRSVHVVVVGSRALAETFSRLYGSD